MAQGQEMLNAMFERLDKFIRTETVVGQPMEVGGVTLVPVITVGFGMGSGGGSGKDREGNDGSGTGGGVGCKISPEAVLVIKEGEVSMLPVKGKASLEKLVEAVPEILAGLDLGKAKPEEPKQASEPPF